VQIVRRSSEVISLPSRVFRILTVWLQTIYILVILSLGLFAAGCASASYAESEHKAQSAVPAYSAEQCDANAEIQAASDAGNDYRIQPGDQLDISFYLNPEFDDNVIVRPDGKITLRLIGQTQAAGLSPGQLSDALDKAYASELRNPGAAVRVKNMPSRLVYVEGEVAKAGSIPLAPGMTALQAIADAGGLTSEANGKAVLIRRDACGTPQQMEVDLHKATNSPAQEDVALMPRDILVVPRSGIANLDIIIDQYIRKLIPVSPYIPIPM
jgi:polysaccharide biosynthesis/export protein